MPRREDIRSVLVIGSGPIVIGQACEFDYSGTQACRVLRDEGIRVVLVNSNPATIMTDPEFADATYVEPITPEVVEAIIAKERPDAVLATLGGQTALNCAMELHKRGVLEHYDCPLIGANVQAIELGEDREQFKGVVARCGAESARSIICHTIEECLSAATELKYPVVVRPSFTMGGLGSGFAYDQTDLRRIAGAGLQYSPVTEVLLEESILGWKEYELEVMRDHKDNVVVVCSIENFDPMGVHTGDSITVAPALTLTDREYQRLRDVGIAVIREVGVDTGGCNIQFAVNPQDGRVIVIEMNPRVSRSSALASKATGFPIAKIAAKMAIGYTLDEVPNDITRETPASFEPTLDYVVVKVPRFAFEKFPAADDTLTTTMKSVGEAMSLGRNFTEALQKALRSIEHVIRLWRTHGEVQWAPGQRLVLLALAERLLGREAFVVAHGKALRATDQRPRRIDSASPILFEKRTWPGGVGCGTARTQTRKRRGVEQRDALREERRFDVRDGELRLAARAAARCAFHVLGTPCADRLIEGICLLHKSAVGLRNTHERLRGEARTRVRTARLPCPRTYPKASAKRRGA